jgi:NTE family protein
MARKTRETVALVLQGGGALGAYQAGAFEALSQGGFTPDWIAGISIGSINAALICGNKPENRAETLRGFWQAITADLVTLPFDVFGQARQALSGLAALDTVARGVPGFFRPRFPWAGFTAQGAPHGTSYYDTEPLRESLLDFVDFDYLNDHGPRLSVGAVDVENGNFTYFDSSKQRIGPEHIMASGALPPGFGAVEVEGRHFWDGGLVSNTPLQYVLENTGKDPMCVFQVDLFSAKGPLPQSLDDVAEREKDIRYSSRTRLTTDRFRQLADLHRAAEKLAAKLPKELQDDPDLAKLLAAGPACPVTLVHLIHRRQAFEGAAKDYEFSRRTMQDHWAEGQADVTTALSTPDWTARKIRNDLQVFDQGICKPHSEGEEE